MPYWDIMGSMVVFVGFVFPGDGLGEVEWEDGVEDGVIDEPLDKCVVEKRWDGAVNDA